MIVLHGGSPLTPWKDGDPSPWMKTPSWTNAELAEPRMRPPPPAGQLPSCGNLPTGPVVKLKQVVPEDLGEGPGCLITGVITGSLWDPAWSHTLLTKDRTGASLETGWPSRRQSLGIPGLCASYPEPRQGPSQGPDKNPGTNHPLSVLQSRQASLPSRVDPDFTF